MLAVASNTPQALPTTWLDDAIPFWTWSLWPYLGFILAQIVLAICVRDPALFHQTLVAYCCAMITAKVGGAMTSA